MKARYGFSMRKASALLVLGLLTIASLSPAADDPNEFALRRERIKTALPGRSLIHSGFAPGAFNKNFYYLAGIRETDATLLIAPRGWSDALFLRTFPDESRLRSMAESSGITRFFTYDLFNPTFAVMLAPPWSLFIPVTYDNSYYFLLNSVKAFPGLHIRSLQTLLTRMRMVKSPAEIRLLAMAAEITAAGVSAAMRAARPGMVESGLQNVIEGVFRSLGSERPSFDSIVGSGPNSVIIHYMDNNRIMQAGELVVMDVGAEFKEYAGDITRTIPVSGTFSPRQREIYDIVLEAELRAIAACRNGATFTEIDLAARDYINSKGYGAYFTHSTTHSLGLDVHDSWHASALEPRLPGVVVTIEPGIYLPEENLGVRIEDDVLITESGPVVLSSFVPKDPDEIERLMAGGFASDRLFREKNSLPRVVRAARRPIRPAGRK